MLHEFCRLPEKSAFKIEEVCGLTGLKPYTLKFWESEFPQIRPIISSFGKKLYEERDLNVIFLVKSMLFEEKLSLEDAKSAINERLQAGENLASQCTLQATSPMGDTRDINGVLHRELQDLLLEIKALQSTHQ
ncbi:MAG: MerR family transcriptional regulator [Bdellovibrionota bacterium]